MIKKMALKIPSRILRHSLSTRHFSSKKNFSRFDKQSNDENSIEKGKSLEDSTDISRVDTEISLPAKEDLPVSADEPKDPVSILREEFKAMVEGKPPPELPIPRASDIAIIGGGAVGSSVAYWLRKLGQDSVNVQVIERDDTYTQAATVLSVGGLRQQFSLKENIEMSLFSAEFMRNIKENLGIEGHDAPDIQFQPHGYLFLASEKGASILEDNYKLQIELGSKVELLSPSQLKQRYPWMSTKGIALGCFGLENEGWFDPWMLLQAFRKKASSLGATYVDGEVIGMKYDDHATLSHGSQTARLKRRLNYCMVKHKDGKIYPMKSAIFINCAGPWSGNIASMAGIGVEPGILRVPLPVEPRKRYVFVFHCPNGPGMATPMIIDPSGLYVRREGLSGHFTCGMSPHEDAEPINDNLDVDYEFFNECIWPKLAERFPVFESLKLKSSWAGYYDYNYYDQNLIIGNHPYFTNLFTATGSSGHGIQHAPLVGKAVAELLLYNEYRTIDLMRFSFDRILDDQPIFERNIV